MDFNQYNSFVSSLNNQRDKQSVTNDISQLKLMDECLERNITRLKDDERHIDDEDIKHWLKLSLMNIETVKGSITSLLYTANRILEKL